MNAQDVETYLAKEQGDQQRPIQTLARAYAALCSGTPPWVSLNEFFHEWFDYSSEQREILIADPIPFNPLPYSSGQEVASRAPHSSRRGERVSNAAPMAFSDNTSEYTRDSVTCHMEPLDQLRWAAVCAGVADYLCQRFGIIRPTWIDDARFVLHEPWYGFGDPGAAQPTIRALLERVTPEPLRRRNVFAGDRMFANKYNLVRREGSVSQAGY